jgi:hypothetical protein
VEALEGEVHAIYQTMYPKESLETSRERVLISLKVSKSVGAMQKAVDEDVKKYPGSSRAGHSTASSNEKGISEMEAREEKKEEPEHNAEEDLL